MLASVNWEIWDLHLVQELENNLETQIHIVINDVKPGLHYIKVSVITVEILHR
jgi:hypothetical protein